MWTCVCARSHPGKGGACQPRKPRNEWSHSAASPAPRGLTRAAPALPSCLCCRQDPGLQALSASAPMIAAWDDHGEGTGTAAARTAAVMSRLSCLGSCFPKGRRWQAGVAAQESQPTVVISMASTSDPPLSPSHLQRRPTTLGWTVPRTTSPTVSRASRPHAMQQALNSWGLS